jgi:hypothetical protein
MEENFKIELSEVIQSSKINFLIGSGASRPFLPVLNNIEVNLNKANTAKEKEQLLKEYLEKVMIPNHELFNEEKSDELDITKKSYSFFFQTLCNLILTRKTTILPKQVNLFTTNIDILMETCLEELQYEYNDGFSGRFNPIFGLENFKKSIFQRSLHFDHISEIPLFNIIKIHGSLSWKHNTEKDKIILAKNLETIPKDLTTKTGAFFTEKYKEILVVNPEESKHLESVLNEYYSELLRLYSSELEKENALLFTLGFSMDDKHIKQITLRAAKSNPTLRIYVCCSKGSKEKMEQKMEIDNHSNIKVICPNNDEKLSVDYFTREILYKVIGQEFKLDDAEQK